MTPIAPAAPGLASLKVTDLASYLHAIGWRATRSPDARLTVFAAPRDEDGNSMSIVLPTRDDFSDTGLRIAEAVAVLADLQGCSTAVLVKRIKSLHRDVVRVRVLTTGRESGGLPLDKVPSLVAELGSVLSFSAAAEEETLPAFTKQRKIGKAFLQRCTFGQTFEGSFGFSIEAPVPPLTLATPETAPFERRVTTRLFHGLSTLRTALQQGDPELLEQDFKNGLNANMCDALVRVARISEDEVFFEPVWSPLLPPAPTLARMNPVGVGERAIELLDAASRKLRTTTQGKDIDLVGLVIELHARVAPAASSVEAEVARQIVVETTERLRVHVPLDRESYRQACDAHRDGRQVRVRGTLDKPGKYWTLMRPEGFAVLPG